MWCKSQDTGDTRETPAIDVCKGLLADNAKLNIFDPKVTEEQILQDLATPKFEWDHPTNKRPTGLKQESIIVHTDPYSACK